MAIRKIVKIGDEVLTKVAKPVTKFDQKLCLLLDDMAETMYEAGGVGLAAPQIGILRRIFVVDIGDGLIEVINPVVTEKSGEEIDIEGCLSIPNRIGLVSRPTKITIEAVDRNGKPITLEAEDFLARAFCHEFDHLQGILYLDIMERELSYEEIQELNKSSNEKEDNVTEKEDNE